MQKYITLEKAVGETPLSCAEAYRANHPELDGVAMAYAGRLDPMASGKLLVLLGDECKNQTAYHSLDKTYEFSVLFGIESDSLDVLGRLSTNVSESSLALSEGVRLGLAARSAPEEGAGELSSLTSTLEQICTTLTGEIKLPYPRFSAKTVQGKPLHMWTLEGRLDEIDIPTKTSTIYSLELSHIEIKSRTDICTEARKKIDTIPEVTEARKALGNDFRRVDVRADWEAIAADASLPEQYYIAHFTCIASSGTYMRTLASIIASKLHTIGLAWSIHRTMIGSFDAQAQTWTKVF